MEFHHRRFPSYTSVSHHYLVVCNGCLSHVQQSPRVCHPASLLSMTDAKARAEKRNTACISRKWCVCVATHRIREEYLLPGSFLSVWHKVWPPKSFSKRCRSNISITVSDGWTTSHRGARAAILTGNSSVYALLVITRAWSNITTTTLSKHNRKILRSNKRTFTCSACMCSRYQVLFFSPPLPRLSERLGMRLRTTSKEMKLHFLCRHKWCVKYAAFSSSSHTILCT